LELERFSVQLKIQMEPSVATILEPDVMIIQMKRFEYDNKNKVTNKKHNHLFCPLTLKMERGSSYTLRAIVNHIGSSPNQGHYNLVARVTTTSY